MLLRRQNCCIQFQSNPKPEIDTTAPHGGKGGRRKKVGDFDGWIAKNTKRYTRLRNQTHKRNSAGCLCLDVRERARSSSLRSCRPCENAVRKASSEQELCQCPCGWRTLQSIIHSFTMWAWWMPLVDETLRILLHSFIFEGRFGCPLWMEKLYVTSSFIHKATLDCWIKEHFFIHLGGELGCPCRWRTLQNFNHSFTRSAWMPFVDETLHILLHRLFNRQACHAVVYEKTLQKKFHSLRGDFGGPCW